MFPKSLSTHAERKFVENVMKHQEFGLTWGYDLQNSKVYNRKCKQIVCFYFSGIKICNTVNVYC